MKVARAVDRGGRTERGVLERSAVRLVCPMCRRELEVPENFELQPFCSGRCKKADLHNWLAGSYRISEPIASTGAEAELLEEEQARTSPMGARRDLS